MQIFFKNEVILKVLEKVLQYFMKETPQKIKQRQNQEKTAVTKQLCTEILDTKG